MEKTTVLTTLDFRTLKYCNLFIMKYKRKTGLWFLITAIISLGIIVYDIIFGNEPYAFAILGGVFLLYSGYQYLNLEKRLDTQLARFFYNKRVTDQTIDITDEKIVVTRSFDPANPSELDWSFVTEIYEMPQFYMLMMGRGAPVIIDRSNEALLEGTKENLDTIIKEKASMKPFRVTDQNIVKRPVEFVHPEFPEVVEETVIEHSDEVELIEETVVEHIDEVEVVENAEDTIKDGKED